MSSINNCSGTLKLRIPKTLHYELIENAKEEGVSLNQLCLMYLTQGINTSFFLGSHVLNNILEKILINLNDADSPDKIFEDLEPIYKKVISLKPVILYEMENFMDDHKIFTDVFADKLESLFPVIRRFHYKEQSFSLKIPSFKLVIKTNNSTLYKDIEKIIPQHNIQLYLGNYKSDLTNDFPSQINDDIVIQFLYEDYNEMKKQGMMLYNKINELFKKEIIKMRFEPTYLTLDLKYEFKKNLEKN